MNLLTPRKHLLPSLLLCLVLILASSGLVQAGQPVPGQSNSGPLPPNARQPGAALSTSQAGTLHLPAMKAVVVVGPLGSATAREMDAAELAAKELEANGVTVYRFYTPNTDWNQIQAAANGAQFFIYHGHGIYWSNQPAPPVGGLGLDQKIYSNDDIRASLHLAPNAIVMLYACFASGGSDTDTASISLSEARRRVAEYSSPYFDLGAGAYFANWYPDSFQMYIRYLFQGMTFGQAYQSFYSYSSAMLDKGTYPTNSALSMWLGYDDWANYPIPPYQYDDAFIGNQSATLESLFAPSMELSTHALAFLARPNSQGASFPVTVQASSPYTFTWTASGATSWASLSPVSGPSGSAFNVTLSPGSSSGTFDATITVNTSDSLVINKSDTVHVRLVVTNTIYKTFLPAIQR